MPKIRCPYGLKRRMKVYKIAILGCENSHAEGFLKLIQEDYPDVQVLGVHSEYPGEAEKLQEKFGVPVMASSDALVGQLDGLIVTARHGARHYPLAKPYLDDGIPLFIDKPTTTTEEDARVFAAELSKRDIRDCGGSVLKFAKSIQELKALVKSGEKGQVLGGFFRAPISLENEYGGFYFYSQHLVQMVGEVFGYQPKSVRACQVGEQVSCTIRYEGFDVSAVYLNNCHVYYGAVNFPNEVAAPVTNTAGAATAEFKEYYDLLVGGKMNQSYEDFFGCVFIINAIMRALESGKEEPVGRL